MFFSEKYMSFDQKVMDFLVESGEFTLCFKFQVSGFTFQDSRRG